MSLISRHPFNGHVNDLIRASAAQSSGVTYVKGALDMGIAMNSAVITIPITLKASYSLSFWIRLKSDHTGSYRKFLHSPGPGTDRSPGFWFHPHSNRIHMRQTVDGANRGADTSEELVVGRWHPVAFSCEVLSDDTTKLTSWLNGNKQSVSIDAGYPADKDGVITLLSGDYDIEDLRTYDHPLSSREVVSLSQGLLSQYRLDNTTHDTEQRGVMSIESGTFIDSDRGKILSLGNSKATIPLADASLDLKGESITFWQRCGVNRSSVGGGGFSNHIIQWGTYYGSNSGGFGIQSGHLSYYLRGPGASGWTTTGNASAANGLYDLGDWIHYAIVFTNDNRFKVYMNGTLYVNHLLSKPYTGLDSVGLEFGKGMQAELSDVRIYKRELTADVVNTQYSQRLSIDNFGKIHSFNVVEKLKARYIRDWLNGSTSNNGKHWLEIRAIRDGVNLSIGKPVTSGHSGSRLTKVTNGSTDNGAYAYVSATGPTWVQVDLGSIEVIDEVKVWHYNADGRTYYGTKTEVSEDGVHWISIFDSDYDGLYPETPSGVTHRVTSRIVKLTPRGLYVPDLSEVGPSENLLAWYPLNNTLEQKALHGDIYSFNAVLDANGVMLNGTSSYFRIPPLFSAGSVNRFTVSMLIKPQSGGRVLCPNSHGVDQFLTYDDVNELISLSITESQDTNGRGFASPPGSVPLNQWSLISFTIDNRDISLYVNDSYVNGVINTGPIGSWHGHWDIGRRANATYYFGGRVKDIRVYNEVLTGDRVALLSRFLRGDGSLMSLSRSDLMAKRSLSEIIV